MKITSKAQYDAIIERLQVLIKYYEIGLETNEYTLKLSNGDGIYLTFPRNQIAHLLGVKTELLKKTNNQEESYKIIKKLINSDITYFDLKSTFGEENIGAIFSDYIDRKLEIFADLLKLRTYNMLFIVKYKTDRSYATGEQTENSDYFIIRKHGLEYSALGICKGLGYDEYLPVTSRLFKSDAEFMAFLNKVAQHQEITYPVFLKIENLPKGYEKKINPDYDEKLVCAKRLMKYANEVNAIPSNTKDSMYIIEKTIDGKQKRVNNYSICNVIKDGLQTGTFIEKSELLEMIDEKYLPTDIDSLVDAANDIICANYRNDEYKGESYSQVKNENDELKKELESLKLTLSERDSLISSLENEKSKLTSECEEKTRKLNILNDAFRSIQ